MTNNIHKDNSLESIFARHQKKFKALADQQRLTILHILSQHQSVCVRDLCELVGVSQSKLSYHLKILLAADLIYRETKGTWSYYQLNPTELRQLLSEKTSSLFL